MARLQQRGRSGGGSAASQQPDRFVLPTARDRLGPLALDSWMLMIATLLPAVTTIKFTATPYIPLALGFFGLGTGYLIYGPQELLKVPPRDRRVDITTGIWGVWMPGFLQFLTGTYLWVGLVWFRSIQTPALYMAALAFTAYGVHWWAIGMGRALNGDARPNGLMSIAFFTISAMGATVFLTVSDIPVAALFFGLCAVYVWESMASFGVEIAERMLGLTHILVGSWLMYLAFAATVNFALGWNWPL